MSKTLLRIGFLREVIMVLDSAYYGPKAKSLVPDKTYDYLLKWLEELVEDNPSAVDEGLPPHAVGHDWGTYQ